MTKLAQIRPMLDAADLDETVAFYTDVLGFTVNARMEGWVSLVRDDVRLMFNQLHTHDHDPDEEHDHEHPSEPIMTGSLYFNVDDVDRLAIDLGGKVSLAFGPETQPHGMREIGFPDPNGYFLIFGMPVEGP
jgi:catechol 2,3-dioxygenase-like lactoylglutathione lyase family enzyme